MSLENKIKIVTYSKFDDSTFAEIETLEKLVFKEPMNRKEILAETLDKMDLLILMASIDGKICGYKVGFRHSSKRFYSWIGGVHPEFRKQGVARALMHEQHEAIKKLGYQYVFTHTKNEWRNMLLLNIKSGFDVIGIRQNLGSDGQAIILEKEL